MSISWLPLYVKYITQQAGKKVLSTVSAVGTWFVGAEEVLAFEVAAELDNILEGVLNYMI